MINDATKDEFELRFYRWAQQDSQREVSQGYPLVRAVCGVGSRSIVRYLESLHDSERVPAIWTLLKRVYPHAAALCGDALTTVEEDWFRTFKTEMFNIDALFVGDLIAVGKRKANRRILRSAIREQLPSVCGPAVERESASTWSHARSFGPWIVVTEIDTGCAPSQLNYFHQIRESLDLTEPALTGMISLFGWMGFGDTSWDLLLESQEASAVESLVRLCEHFMSAVPRLLDGLEPGG